MADSGGDQGMGGIEDLSDRCLVITASDARWREVLRPALRTASLPDGRSLEPELVHPRAFVDASALRPLDLLEYGAVVVADLSDVNRPLFSLLAWHGRSRPKSVLLLRPGSVALPYELHDFPVLSYDATVPEEAAKGRMTIARRATQGAQERSLPVAGGEAWTSEPGNRRERRRRRKNGVEAALRHADLCMLARDVGAATRAVEAAREADPEASDVLLRLALLYRASGRWPDAIQALETAVQVEPRNVAAWRELGIVRDRANEPEAETALRTAVDLGGDYPALVALATLVGRRGDRDEALRLLDRAIEASEGQVNLSLPAAVLRAARDRRVEVVGRERERIETVLAIRQAQAAAVPPEDVPWSHFDALLASLLLGDGPGASRLAEAAKAHVHAGWETETLGDSLDSLASAGVEVGEIRRVLGIRPKKAASVVARRPETRRPYAGALRDPGWFRENVPCAAACPVGTDAGAYVRLIAEHRFEDAFQAARGPNPFASVCGRVCAAPCEEACRRGSLDEPVAIRPLKRFLTERHGSEASRPRVEEVLRADAPPCMEGDAYVSHLRKLGSLERGARRRVAVVGGGPAGLACAHDLAFLGYRVTLLEASARLGGMMRHGIPEYRLPRDVLDAEIDAILRLGVEVRLETGLSAQRTLRALLDEGHEAAFLASGASRGRDLDVEGASLDGVVRAIDFLINVNNDFRVDLGSRVVVMGGGNVAIDVARTARLGRPPQVKPESGIREAAKTLGPALRTDALRSAFGGFEGREVHVVARQPFGQWPAQKSVHGREEVEEAQREGVLLHPLRGIRRILGRDGRVTGVELAEVVRLVDERGRYAPLYGSHAAEEIPCDTVLLAVGQEPDLDYLEGTAEVGKTKEGFIAVDPETLATSMPGVYAGGDAAFGPRTLIEAVAEGKRAARSIHAHLTGGRRLPVAHTFRWVAPRGIYATPDYDALPRQEPSTAAVERRTGIAEIEGCYEESVAVAQASRCLTCHVQTVYDGDRCIACGHCTEVCPHACLTFVRPDDVAPSDPAAATWAGSVAGEGRVFLLKDETLCVRCGLCAERCPTGAMTMERFDMAVTAPTGAGAAEGAR